MLGLVTRVLLVQRPKLSGPGTHEGVLVATEAQQVVYDKGVRGIRRLSPEAFAAGHRVQVAGESPDPGGALERLDQALAEAREFIPWGDNCQHFARFVVFGKAESPELQAVGWTALLLYLFTGGDAA